MRHPNDSQEPDATPAKAFLLPSLAASILLAAFAVAGVYSTQRAANVYGSASTDLVSTSGTVRTSSPRSNEGPTWDDLDSDQQTVLAPLQEQWKWVSEAQKRRWIIIADSFDDFSPEEQLRIAEHMKDWAKLSLGDRSQARLNYSNADKLSAEQKRELWDEYQALSARERKRLAQGSFARPGGALALRPPGTKGSSRLVKVPAAAVNPNRANPPKILPPPEIRIQSRGIVTPVEVGPLPANQAPVPTSPPPAPTPVAPAVETAPVHTPSPVTPAPLPPAPALDAPAPIADQGSGSSGTQSRISDKPVHPPV